MVPKLWEQQHVSNLPLTQNVAKTAEHSASAIEMDNIWFTHWAQLPEGDHSFYEGKA